jgi:hypothetical protein
MVDLGPTEPWLPPVLPWPPTVGFIQVASLLNPITGKSVPMAAEVHSEDLDWLCRSWESVFEIEWKVRNATLVPRDDCCRYCDEKAIQGTELTDEQRPEAHP